MNSRDSREQEIIRSWHANAAAWSEAIRTESIASRKLVTNQAIIEAVTGVAVTGVAVAGVAAARPERVRVLDIGCGEGWLAHVLSERGMSVTGIDIVPELIARAMASSPAAAARRGSAAFEVQAYASIAGRSWRAGPFDMAVCNFSLLGGESVDSLIAALPSYLGGSGHLIVQTLHPVAACGAEPYRDGWREGSWQGFSGDFRNPAPWYFRTLESWRALLERSGFDILGCREPRAPGAAAPCSVIWIGKRRRSAQT